MRSTHAAVVLGLATLAAGFAACSGGGETTASSSTGAGGATTSATSDGASTTGGGGAPSTSSASGTGGEATASSSSASSSSGGPVYGYCTKPCGTVADCCPAGSMGCPSNMYPNNYSCDKSACKAPQCASTADCAAVDPTQECLVLPGFNACSATCKNDGECMAPATCSGVDANGKKYCFSNGGGGCADDAACGGLGKCVNKVCVCASTADCTKPGFTACAL
jgi:hypothetical protein